LTKSISLPKKLFNSLLYSILQAINKQSTPIYGKVVRNSQHLKEEHFKKFQIWIDKDVMAIKSKTFQPEKYTDPHGTRRFNLMPIYNFQLRHIQLDAQTFPPILRKAGLWPSGTKRNEEEIGNCFWRYFDFTKIGINSQQELATDRCKFW
jgi:hypothetical protein